MTLDGPDYLGWLQNITWGDWGPVCLARAEGPREQGRGGWSQSAAGLVLRTKSTGLMGVSQRLCRLRVEAGQGKVEARGPARGSHGPEREEGMEEVVGPGMFQGPARSCPLEVYAVEGLLDNQSIHNTIKFQVVMSSVNSTKQSEGKGEGK